MVASTLRSGVNSFIKGGLILKRTGKDDPSDLQAQDSFALAFEPGFNGIRCPCSIKTFYMELSS